MIFFVADKLPRQKPNQNCIYLIADDWNDWFKYVTQFTVYAYSQNSEEQHIGSVKIGKKGMNSANGKTELPNNFEALSDEYFSLGQSDEYYEYFANSHEILRALNDVVLTDDLRASIENELIYRESLTREVPQRTITGKFKRIINGQAKLTDFYFDFSLGENFPNLTFSVEAMSLPPTNVHVLIGSNGVGKTTLLNKMATTLFENEKSATWLEKYEPLHRDLFSGLIIVAFSAFDVASAYDFNEVKNTFPMRYIGLRGKDKDGNVYSKSIDSICEEFIRSFKQCKREPKRKRAKAALLNLKSDPIFADMNIEDLLYSDIDDEGLKHLFSPLSSGHKIVLLSLVNLVDNVDEKSLILIDEPESHLHPPLLSGFIRSLSELLADRNGVAIIATHSPVVLQEVPKSCVWKIIRYGNEFACQRPEIETFGENTGTLTREVFGLQVVNSGYNSLLKNIALSSNFTYEEVLEKFKNQLGNEAKMILRSLTRVK